MINTNNTELMRKIRHDILAEMDSTKSTKLNLDHSMNTLMSKDRNHINMIFKAIDDMWHEHLLNFRIKNWPSLNGLNYDINKKCRSALTSKGKHKIY